MNYFSHLLIILVTTLLMLTGCKSNKKDYDLIIPADELYTDGIKLFENQAYQKAADKFEELFLQHPGNDITPKAELMQAYSLFLAKQYDEAIDVLDMFIKLHPKHIDIAYAYHLKALSYYAEISPVELDQSKTYFTKVSFEEVISRFPETDYAKDAAKKMQLIDDRLAAKEMEIGRYYLSLKNPIASINRFQNVINNYPYTNHVPEALYRIIIGYSMLNLQDVATQYLDQLKQSYPENKWYINATRDVRGFLN